MDRINFKQLDQYLKAEIQGGSSLQKNDLFGIVLGKISVYACRILNLRNVAYRNILRGEIADERNEYWYGREIMPLLGYKKWDNFQKVLKQSMISCENSNISVLDHFLEVKKMVDIGSKTKRKISDYKLSRYACYLIAQNGDSRKKSISLAQTYFAIQTRKQELLERDYNTLSEDEKRIYQRFLTRKGNLSLNKAAKDAGVKNFDKFHNAGYKGLYNGETADDIAKRKG